MKFVLVTKEIPFDPTRRETLLIAETYKDIDRYLEGTAGMFVIEKRKLDKTTADFYATKHGVYVAIV